MASAPSSAARFIVRISQRFLVAKQLTLQRIVFRLKRKDFSPGNINSKYKLETDLPGGKEPCPWDARLYDQRHNFILVFLQSDLTIRLVSKVKRWSRWSDPNGRLIPDDSFSKCMIYLDFSERYLRARRLIDIQWKYKAVVICSH